MSAPQGLTEPGESELVAGVLAGDRQAFAAIYDRYADRLHDFCHSVLRDRDEAADATQDTFVVVAERLSQLRDPERLRPWLYAVARNEALRRIRARGRLASDTEVDEMADRGAGPAEAAEQAALRDLVWSAAAGLSDRDRVLLDLHLRHGLEGAELAEAMGVRVGHAYVLLTRLRDQVERSLGALLVARLGRKGCAELDGLLTGWDGRFSPLIRKRVARHVDRCPTCTDRRRAVASPWALLSTVALAPAPLYLRDQVLQQVELVAHRGPAPPVGRGPTTRPRVLAAAAVLVIGAAVLLWHDGTDSSSSPVAGAPPGPSAAAPTPAPTPASTTIPGTTEPSPSPGAPPPTGIQADQPTLAVSPTTLDLGSTAVAGTIALRNDGDQRLSWTAKPSAEWLAADPAGGTLPSGASTPVTLRVNRASLAEGDASATVDITWVGGNVPVLVTLTEERPPEIIRQAASPPSIGIRSCPNDRTSVRASVTDESGVSSVTLSWSQSGGPSSSLSMALRGGQWYAPLGPFDGPDDVVFTITATDTRGNTATGAASTLPVIRCVN